MLRAFFIMTLCLGQLGLPFVQVIAWVGMIYSYSVSESSLKKGVELTFEGKQPCHLCNAIKSYQEKEQERSAEHSKSKSSKLEAYQPFIGLKPEGFAIAFKLFSKSNMLVTTSELSMLSQWIVEQQSPPPRKGFMI